MIISAHSTCIKTANYPITKLVGECTHIPHKTLNLVISRCCFVEDGKEMHLQSDFVLIKTLFCVGVVAVAVAVDVA